MMERNPRRKRVYFTYGPTRGKPRQELTQGRNLKAGSDAEGLEESWLLAHSLHSPRQLNSTTQNQVPTVGWDLPQ